MTQHPPQPRSLDIVFEEIRERIAVQLDQANHLDSKAGNLLAFSSIVLTVAAA